MNKPSLVSKDFEDNVSVILKTFTVPSEWLLLLIVICTLFRLWVLQLGSIHIPGNPSLWSEQYFNYEVHMLQVRKNIIVIFMYL